MMETNLALRADAIDKGLRDLVPSISWCPALNMVCTYLCLPTVNWDSTFAKISAE
jgi:hypothetical protein